MPSVSLLDKVVGSGRPGGLGSLGSMCVWLSDNLP